MLSRYLLSRLPLVLHERPQTGEDAQHILPFGITSQISRRVAKDELDFLVSRSGLEYWLRRLFIGGAHQTSLVPRYDEQDSPIIRMRDHDGRIAVEKGLIKDKMHPSTGLHHCLGVLILHLQNLVGEHTRCIDHDGPRYLMGIPRLGVREANPRDVFVLVPEQTRDLAWFNMVAS